MARDPSLVSDLETLLGGEAVLPPDRCGDFTVDGLVPRAAVAPASVEQVAEVLRYAHRQGLALIPWGGGTMMRMGNVPRRYDIALSLSRLNRVLEHEPADLTLTCQAGVTLAEVQRHLAPAGQLLPLDPPQRERATIGGTLAASASGPSRHAYGTARDFTIGLRAVTAHGRIIKAGGRVVKNVAGYDLCKLYIGSLGSLGVIVEATFKLFPLPRAERAFLLALDSASAACALARELHRRGLSLRSLQLLNRWAAAQVGLAQPGPYLLLLHIAGSPPAVERTRREALAAASPAAQSIDADLDIAICEAAAGLASPSHHSLLGKLALLPTEVPKAVEACHSWEHPASVLAWPTVGIVYMGWATGGDTWDLLPRLRRLAAQLGGNLTILACPEEAKEHIDVFGELPSPFPLMRRLKEQWDPQGVLSPGRFLGRL